MNETLEELIARAVGRGFIGEFAIHPRDISRIEEIFETLKNRGHTWAEVEPVLRDALDGYNRSNEWINRQITRAFEMYSKPSRARFLL